jgi:L-serine dehydratase
MFLSILDVFKIGIGPSSSHTMGPMTAARRFLDLLRGRPEGGPAAAAVRVSLHGSLAFTGKGHATDRAVTLGLLGYAPAELDMDEAERRLAGLRESRELRPPGLPKLGFDPAVDIVFDFGPPLPGHANGLIFSACDAAGEPVVSETYYSIGGGFVVTAAERAGGGAAAAADAARPRPYPFDSAAAMLAMARESGLSIAEMKRRNELASLAAAELDGGIARIWETMNGCIERGLTRDGELPGGLHVRRRARRIFEQLRGERNANSVQPHAAADWLSAYAMAVNEENAAGGKVVTAPTNGAAGVVPAVLRYYLDHCVGADAGRIPDFLLTAAAIGGLLKHNASISGAEAGCQGEVGSAGGHGGGGAVRRARRLAGAGGERRRDRAGASSRHDLRSGGRAGAGAVHRAERHRGVEGGCRRLARAARRRFALHAARQLHPRHAADRRGDEQQVQGDEPGRPRRQPAGMLSITGYRIVIETI